MFLFGSTRKVRIPKRMLGDIKGVKKDVNKSWEGHQTIKKIWYHIMSEHGIHDLNILFLMLKPNHVVIYDMW